jgi:hypothetical protein
MNTDERCECCEKDIAALREKLDLLTQQVDALTELVGKLLPPPIIPHEGKQS